MNERISQKIAEVIAKRQSLAHKIIPVEQHLNNLRQEVNHLHQSYQKLQSTIQASGITSNLTELEVHPLESDINNQTAKLQKLRERVSRPTLNIGVVGLMRQGKSTLLQQISGLNNQEIPARPGGACTAVRSAIYHKDTDTYAEVIMHSEGTFLKEVIEPYYKHLALGKAPTTLDEFSAWQPHRTRPSGTLSQTMYDHLVNDYHTNLRFYRSELRPTPRTLHIKQQDIPQFVSQERNQQGRLTTYKHLPVKQVNIFCRFQKFGVDRLGLIDIPGIGDTRLGDEELMLKALHSEVDVVVFLRRPDSKGDQWQQKDFNLYDSAAQVLPDLENRSFMILNHQNQTENNTTMCHMFQQQMGRMAFVDTLIKDCSKLEESNQLLEIILTYLEEHILGLEERFAQECQGQVLLLSQRLEELCHKATLVMHSYTEEVEIIGPRIQAFKESLTHSLRKMVHDLEMVKEENDTDFQKAVESAISQCRSSNMILSEKEIQRRAESPEMKNSYRATAYVLMVEMRANISQHFLTLDNGLKQAANKLKKHISEVFLQQTGLKNLTPAQDIMFLTIMNDLLVKANSPLSRGFQALLDFDIRYGSLLLKKIREELLRQVNEQVLLQTTVKSPIPSNSPTSLHLKTAINVAAGMTGINNITPVLSDKISDALIPHVKNEVLELTNSKLVRERLQQLQIQAIVGCENILQDWLSEPNRIRYYMAAEFVELVIDAEGMSKAWENFLWRSDVKALLWEEIKQIDHLKRLQGEWLQDVKRLNSMNQIQSFKFL